MRLAQLVTAPMLAILLASCSKQNSAPVKEQVEQAAKTAGEKMAKAAEAARDVTAAKKEEYARKVEDEFAEHTKRIDELKKKAQSMAGDAKAQFMAQLADVEKKREAVKRKMGDLKTSSSQAWGDIRDGIDHAMADLTDAYEKAKSRF